MRSPLVASAALLALAPAGCGSTDPRAHTRVQGSIAVTPQVVSARAPDRFDAKRAYALTKLQVSYGQRPAGSPPLRKLAERLVIRLPHGHFENVPGQPGVRNIVGTLPGRRPGIVVGAHYDTLVKPAGFVGANNGAAGSAIVIELAHALAKTHRPKDARQVRFVLFDGEEPPAGLPEDDPNFAKDGLRGSRAYVKAHPHDTEAMILLDYVGNRELQLPREGTSTAALWNRLRSAADRVDKIGYFPPAVETPIIDDHTPFLETHVPAIDLIDWRYPGHTLKDGMDKIDPDALDAVGESVLELVRELRALELRSRVVDLREARDLLLEHREDYAAARAAFAWPAPAQFNWALDWFDAFARDNERTGLWVVGTDGEQTLTFDALSRRSDRLANWLRSHGVAGGDRIVLMLANQVELWETMLAAMKLGAVVIPATTLLAEADLRDRIERGRARHVIARSPDAGKWEGVAGDYTKIAVGEPVDGWLAYADFEEAAEEFSPDGATQASDTLLLYFTSGTTARPKLVEHTHASYPIGHLSTMYWLGLQPGDVHLNLSSPGWAKHAWSNFFAPWLAEATVLVHDYERFDAAALLRVIERCGVTTFCAPPTVWRMLIQADLRSARTQLREVVGAGEPLNPEIIEQVKRAWGLTLRDGYGQTETTAQIGNPPGQPLKPGSMGRPLPGYAIALIDPASGEAGDEGEICIDLSDRPAALMVGYRDDAERNAEAMAGGYYHTGDVATRDADGYITYVGRTDDVFKASDYRISPFELESVLIEHDAVAEAAVVPSPDPLRLAVPKAYVVLAAGWEPDRDTALTILRHCRENLAPYKRIRRLEFAELPKTISGKIRRVELRGRELRVHGGDGPVEGEFSDADFPELRA